MSKTNTTVIETLDINAKSAELTALSQQMLEMAAQQGADAAEISASFSTGLSVTARNGDVENIEYQRDRGLALTVYYKDSSVATSGQGSSGSGLNGYKQAHASTSDFSEAAIKKTVAAACDIAKATQPDPYAGLAEPEQMATAFPDLDLYHPWQITPDEAIDIAVRMDNAALQYDQRITNSDGASVDTGSGVTVVANSCGFLGVKTGSRHSMSCSTVAGSGDNMERDYNYVSSRLASDFPDPEQLGRQAAKGAIARLDARRIQTASVPVLFRADVAKGIIGHAISAMSGSALYRDASFLKGRLNEQVFVDSFNLQERPHLLQGSGSSSFDSDGLATPAHRYLIENGILNTYLLGVYSARKLGMQSTAHAGGVRNLLVQPTVNLGLNDLANQIGTGFLVTELMGQGVNAVTGDYSRGASGFWVENGEIAFPVCEATIAGNLTDMYQHITAIGNDIDMRGNMHIGSMVIEGMTVAGEG